MKDISVYNMLGLSPSQIYIVGRPSKKYQNQCQVGRFNVSFYFFLWSHFMVSLFGYFSEKVLFFLLVLPISSNLLTRLFVTF